jgi:hypothetical protein
MLVFWMGWAALVKIKPSGEKGVAGILIENSYSL